MKLFNKIFYWAVMVVGSAASIWPLFYENNNTLYITLYLVYIFVALMSSIFMVIALWKIRSFLRQRGLGAKLSPLRMLVHALAFVLYVFMYFCFTAMEELKWQSSQKLFMVHWLIDIVTGWVSFICLFYVLWHLGTKDVPIYVD